MITLKKTLLINVCLSIVSLTGTFAIGYYLYTTLQKPPENILFTDTNDEYMFSLYNRKGEKLGDVGGPFKLMTDPFTIYQNYPNQQSRKYSINNFGFRDTYTANKPYKAIVLGGSAAFGFALDSNDQSFSSIISRYNEKYNVLNAAVIGFLSGQELSQMIHYLDDFSPSLYIVFDGWNDIYDPYVFAKGEFKEGRLIHQPPIGYNNAFLGIESRLAEYFQTTRKDKKLPLFKLDPVGEYLNERELFQKVLEKYVTNIEKMHAFAKSRGAQFLLVFQGELGNKKVLSSSEREVLRTWIDRYGYLDNKISERYKKFITSAKTKFEESNIVFIDINDEYEFSENPQALFFDVVHPNQLGHQIIAKIINQTVSEKF
jgi:hypothetical protein